MVAAYEHWRHALTIELGGAGVLRVLEQATVLGGREGLVHVAHLVAQGSGNEPYDGIGHDHSGQLAAREHVVADRQALIGIRIGALVDALVTAAHKQQALAFEQALGHMLRKGLAAGGEEHHGGLGTLRADGLDCLGNRLDLHEHALPAAIRLVIDGAMAVVRPVAQVIRLKIKKAGLAGAAQNRRGHDGLKHLGKDRKGLNQHAVLPTCPYRSSRP